MRSNVEKISDINRLIEDYKAEAELINRNQALLGWEVTPFAKLTEIVTAKDPYEKLWNTAWSFYTSSERWINGAFRGLNAEAIGEEVGETKRRRHFEQVIRENNMTIDVLGSKYVANIAQVAEDFGRSSRSTTCGRYDEESNR